MGALLTAQPGYRGGIRGGVGGRDNQRPTPAWLILANYLVPLPLCLCHGPTWYSQQWLFLAILAGGCPDKPTWFFLSLWLGDKWDFIEYLDLRGNLCRRSFAGFCCDRYPRLPAPPWARRLKTSKAPWQCPFAESFSLCGIEGLCRSRRPGGVPER